MNSGFVIALTLSCIHDVSKYNRDTVSLGDNTRCPHYLCSWALSLTTVHPSDTTVAADHWLVHNPHCIHIAAQCLM